MISVDVKVQCDCCGKVAKASYSSVNAIPDVHGLLAAVRWGLFLDGMAMCDVCQNNAGEVQRVSGIHLEASKGVLARQPKKYPSDEEILKAAELFNRPTDAAKSLGLGYHYFHTRIKRLQKATNGTTNHEPQPTNRL